MAPKTMYLKLALYNAGSLRTGQDDFLIAMNNFDADIVAITETWIQHGQEQLAPAVPGYKYLGTPRPSAMRGGRGGGLAFYCKHCIGARRVAHPAAQIEQMWLRVTVNSHRIIIGTAYRPNWVNVDTFLDALTESITSFSNYDYIVLLGDFNINMLHENHSMTLKLKTFLHCLGLEQVVKEPTHYSVNSESLIDVVCTNAPTQDVCVTNITGSLGHAMITVTLPIKRTKPPPKTMTFRAYKDIDMNAFNSDLHSLDWDSVLGMDSVDNMVMSFNSLLLSLFNKHAPIKTVKIRQDHSLPWITDTIKIMIKKRNEAHVRHRQTKLEEHKKYYLEFKKLVVHSIWNEKRAYYNYNINSHYNDSKILWKNLKKTILTDSKNRDCLPDHLNNPNAINDNFLTVPGGDKISVSTLSYFEFHRYGDTTFTLRPVNESDVAKYIMSISTNAVGVDGIGKDMIVLSLPCILPVITAIVNKSILSGEVPDLWKSALVNPLPKVDNPSQFKDLRPISILPFLSKVLEKAVYTQLSQYVENNNILPMLQSGFRKGMGTVTALLDVVDNILAEQDCGKGTCLVLLDFSRAFDSIDVPLLLSKLSYYGLDHDALSWFHNYLSGRTQSVKIVKEDGSLLISDQRPLTRGVPQGSILGPLLFIIYGADIIKAIKHCKYHLYADDVQLYLSAPPRDFSQSVCKLNEDLDSIAKWADKNGLLLNPQKSKFMILGSKNQINTILDINPILEINQSPIERVDEAKNLGIIIDSHLRFESHIKNLVKSCFFRLKVLYKIRNLLSEKVRVTLCESLVLSVLNYGDIVYGARLQSKTRRLVQRVQNACCRFCYSIPPRSHITPYLNKTSTLSMSSRRHLHLACLLFDVLKYKKPDYLFSRIKISTFHERHGTRSTRRCLLEAHPHRTAAFKGSFRYLATKCWNNIPPPLRRLKTKQTFKLHCRKLLLEKQVVGIPHGYLVADFLV